MSVVLRAEDEPVGSRFDYWRHVMGDALVPLDIQSAVSPAELRDQAVLGQAGAVRVSEMTITAGAAARTPRLIRRSDPDVCKIDVLTAGHMVVEQAGRESTLGPGDFALVDLSRPARWSSSAPVHGVAVMFPRALLPLRDDELVRLAAMRIAGDRGAARLVASVARQLPADLDEAPPGELVGLGTAVVDLLSVALAGRLDRRSVATTDARQRALLLRIHEYVEHRLADTDLGPTTIAADHHISVRYLHKLFEAQQTTVAGWIRSRRLDRCRRDLLDTSLAGRPVSAIAARWGFTNPTHFSRAFRTAYGAPPGEYREACAGLATAPGLLL